MSCRSVVLCVGSLCLLLLSPVPLACAGVLITGAEEVGGIADGVPPYVTGETFDHELLGADFEVPFLDEDVPFFVDRRHQYNGFSATDTLESLGLVGAEYVMLANDNKGVADYELEIRVAQTADAFFFYDQRNPQPAPQWLADGGWVWTGYEIGIDEVNADGTGGGVGPGVEINNRFWIYKKSDIAPGILKTYESNSAGNNMYGIAFLTPGQGPGIKDFPDEWPGEDFQPGNFGLIDIGATGGRPENGALQDELDVAQIGAAAHNENGFSLDAREMTSSLGNKFSIAIDNLDQDDIFVGRMDWRDRGTGFLADIFGLPLIKVGEDLVKNNEGVIRVTLSDLPAGPYEVTSYHIDPGYTQCEAISILVDNGDGQGFVDTEVLGNASLINVPVGNLTPEIVLNAGATFNFIADGVHDVMILFDGRMAADREVPLNGLNIQFGTVSKPGDYNKNGQLDAEDLDLQAAAMVAGGPKDPFDLNKDNAVDFADRKMWLHDLRKTWVGDSNLDGQFKSDDFVLAFQGGKYEVPGATATWVQGDWSGDQLFTSADFVDAFADGGYEAGPRPGAVSAVPEPSAICLMLLGLLLLPRRRW